MLYLKIRGLGYNTTILQHIDVFSYRQTERQTMNEKGKYQLLIVASFTLCDGILSVENKALYQFYNTKMIMILQ